EVMTKLLLQRRSHVDLREHAEALLLEGGRDDGAGLIECLALEERGHAVVEPRRASWPLSLLAPFVCLFHHSTLSIPRQAACLVTRGQRGARANPTSQPRANGQDGPGRPRWAVAGRWATALRDQEM